MNLVPIQRFEQQLPAILGLIADLVNIESPTTDKAAVDRLGARVVQELEQLNGEIKILPQANSGNHILCRWGEGSGGILLMSHMDTVFDMGFLAANPFRENEGRLYGPGVLDMKSSIALLLTVLRTFKEDALWPGRPITALFTSDEETGSHTSREIVEEEAAKAELVLCLEPALANGALKTARKGTGEINLRVQGVAAHAGANHAKGRNAIEELSHHILAAQQLTDYSKETTVNVGRVGGGTRNNVVPDEAWAVADLRVAVMDEFRRLESWVKNRQPVIEGTTLLAEISLNRPPMPRDELMAQTFQKAKAIGRELGFDLTEGSTGGGSDANFAAPLGVAILDGLGAVGDGAHSEREYVEVNSLPERAALLAGILLNW